MQTDEYENLLEETALCRNMVRQSKYSLQRREKECGMNTEAFLQMIEEGCLSEQHPIQRWNKKSRVRALAKEVDRIRQALESLKWL